LRLRLAPGGAGTPARVGTAAGLPTAAAAQEVLALALLRTAAAADTSAAAAAAAASGTALRMLPQADPTQLVPLRSEHSKEACLLPAQRVATYPAVRDQLRREYRRDLFILFHFFPSSETDSFARLLTGMSSSRWARK
jgi:hypothetical protein